MSLLTPAQIQDVKASVDIFTLAGQRTTLRNVARNEWAGPCPSAACDGDTDSVHVHADGWWFCRKCHEKRSDAIGFVMHYEGVNFVAACEWIAGPGMKLPATPIKPQRAERKPPQWNTDVWQQRAYELIDQAAAQLETPAGAAARAYLEQRGIMQHTWRCWLLGYTLSHDLLATGGHFLVAGRRAHDMIRSCAHGADRPRRSFAHPCRRLRRRRT